MTKGKKVREYNWKKINNHQRFQDKMRKDVNKVLVEMRQLIASREIKGVSIKQHLVKRMSERKIIAKDVLETIEKGKMVEYQGSHENDEIKKEELKRNIKSVFNPNCVNLILGYHSNGKTTHVCLNIRNKDEIHIKTVYNPEKEESHKWVKDKDYMVRAFYK